MENASKALIIAGAILLAILIIGLGVFIYNQASNSVTGVANTDQMEIQKFNDKFEPYLNKTLSGASAKSLLQTIESSNYYNEIIIDCGDAKSTDILKGHTYTTDVEYTNGYITKIILTDLDAGVDVGDNGNGDTPGGGDNGNGDAPGGDNGEPGDGGLNGDNGNYYYLSSTEFNNKFEPLGILSYDQVNELKARINEWNTFKQNHETNAPSVQYSFSGDAFLYTMSYYARENYDENGYIYRITVTYYNNGGGGVVDR